jgi:hypothetical protein
MSESCEHKNPLQHGGTTQAERIVSALDPANTELHGLTEANWLEFASNYARLLNYYGDDNPEVPAGDWQHFFESEGDIQALLNRVGDGSIEPHMALFLSFLKLLAYPKMHLNELPKRHLDFYYKEVLRIRKKPATADHVHVLFELAKNATDEFIDLGTSLKAGKDADGKPMVYETVTPLVVNRANIASVKSIHVDRTGGSEILRNAPMSKSADGVEEELEDGESWSAFGNQSWPNAELAFYVASDLLLLKEGTRLLSLKFKLREEITLAKNHLKAFVTGQDDWIEAVVTDIDDGNSRYNFIINIEINRDEDAVTAYNDDVHGSGLPTSKPSLRIVFTQPHQYSVLKDANISELNLEVRVLGASALELKNELGNIDPEKPFMPFGSRPKVGSRLSVKYPELSGKPVSNIEFSMEWLNTPSNFSIHYRHYEDAIKEQKKLNELNIGNYGNYMPLVVQQYYAQPFNEAFFLFEPIAILLDGGEAPGDEMKSAFTAALRSPYMNGTENFELFKNTPQISSASGSGTKRVSNPEVTFTLRESFYHDLYSKIYVNAVLAAPPGSDADLPNEPYTPLLDSLTMNYTAQENISFTSDDDPTSLMFHQHPFGIKRAMENDALVPDYTFNELYIGLEGMESGSNISLLFQVAEGTEDPLLSTFEENDIDWWVLSDDDWINIRKEDFARNQTNNFLKSGIVELALPKVASMHHSLLKNDLHWLRIRLKKEHQSVCRFINIHAQAAEAAFQNLENSLDHLDNGLPPESIGKMTNSRAAVKGVSQPYPGFGGSPEEQDISYYRRVSERLRHKKRAISIWDYEHLVLEQFPSLYKVKCLNHCYWDGNSLDEMSPGNVTLVLIPKLPKGNSNYRMEPRVSRNFMDEVEDFLNQQNSGHANLKAVNAVYEPVRFEFGVEFRKGLDFNFHKKQIIADLKRMVAPWVFDEEAAIEFGGSFSEYQVVHYIEKLNYVDYISNFKMFHKPVSGTYSQKPFVEPSIPMAILIPVFDERKINETRECD